MTTHEAFITGMLWGALNRLNSSMPYEVDCPAENPGLLVLRWKSGTEVLVTITETRTPPTPEP